MWPNYLRKHAGNSTLINGPGTFTRMLIKCVLILNRRVGRFSYPRKVRIEMEKIACVESNLRECRFFFRTTHHKRRKNLLASSQPT